MSEVKNIFYRAEIKSLGMYGHVEDSLNIYLTLDVLDKDLWVKNGNSEIDGNFNGLFINKL